MIPFLSVGPIPLGPLTLQPWGLGVALGCLAMLGVSLREARRLSLGETIVWDALTLGLSAALIGARLFYAVFTAPDDPAALWDPHAGFTLAGGALVSLLAVFLYLRRTRQDIGRVLDALTPGLVLALLGARLGCFLISDHPGRVTGLPWGMEYLDGSVRHPVALYHLLFLGAIFLYVWRRRLVRRPAGFLFLDFLALYAAGALGADFSRCDDLAFCEARFRGLTATQWLLMASLLGAGLLKKRLKRANPSGT